MEQRTPLPLIPELRGGWSVLSPERRRHGVVPADQERNRMCVRRILLPLGGMSHAESALQVGGAIARMFDAHLAVLHVGTDMQEVGPLT